jgi:hypothetical protein
MGEVRRSGDTKPPSRVSLCLLERIRCVLEEFERTPDTLPVQDSILGGLHEPGAATNEGNTQG